MAEVGIHPVRLYDSDGDALDNGDGKLKVVLSASDNIEIGDVDIKLNGTGVSAGADAMDNGTIRVALATDDYQFGAHDDGASSTGSIHAKLRSIFNSLATLSNIQTYTSTTSQIVNAAISTTGGEYAEGDGGFLATGVRNDTLASLVSADHDHAPFQVNASGALYVEVASSATLSVNSHAVTNAGTFATQVDGDALTALQLIDDTVATLGTDTYAETSTKGNVIGVVRNDILGALANTNNEIAPLQVNEDGALWIHLDTTTGASNAFNVASGAASSSQRGIVPLIKMNEVVAAPSGHVDNDWTYFQTDLNGSLYTTHGMTGMAQGNTTVGTDAMQLDEGTNGYDVACKRVDLTSDPNNAGHIYVGSADTIAANGSVGGIRLNAGDFYSLDINNLTHIWVEASEAGQELNFIYYT